MMDGLTDNRNRTGPEIKKIFEKRGGSLGASGCVAWMFDKKGVFTVNSTDVKEDDLMEIVLTAGADDMENFGEIYEVTCEPAAFEEIKAAFADNEIATQSSELAMVPQNTVPVSNAETARKLLALMEEFEDHDDVQNVYANFDIADEILSEIE